MRLVPAVPRPIEKLVGRFDADVFDPRRRRTRVRLVVDGAGSWDVVIEGDVAKLGAVSGSADALLRADAATWTRIAREVRSGMAAHEAGSFTIRKNLHVGVGFLAATGVPEPGRLRFRTLRTPRAALSVMEAGEGPVVLALHGLGGTKGSFLPTVAALADRFRVIAVDLPGFGDSDKPLGAPYDARFFADVVVDLLDALAVKRAHLVGNSLGGRIALEVALRHPRRVGRLGLLTPSLAWRRDRPLLRLLRLTRPELGLLQPAPAAIVRRVVHQLLPDADDGWAAAGVDEFLRVFGTRSGRAAFYAAARQIYLDEPHGEKGFWTRLPELRRDALFVWGRNDRLVPIGFARHVSSALPNAAQLELDCGHVPQAERPRETHAALAAFFGERAPASRRASGHVRITDTRAKRRASRARSAKSGAAAASGR